ncbi:type II secretion system protein [Coraliomargarita algicola]|uniref:Type II secretion system protein n=1 Tax=Coraliomargarita algicola TaxID=3092156 RepID=A0ABZ0RJK5_9BACT|nr:type II secretion system protein [Coraliomargarita sp. J2-16]WPJ95263.1 type II secretion system protein [Coraliomargarita sp. J2-16]
MLGPLTHKKQGFTLVELAISTSIIGLLAAVSLPAFQRSRDNVRIGALEHDLRLYEQEFDTFELDYGSYPSSHATAGAHPEGMIDRMSEAWKLPSPIGGTYRWIYTTEAKPSDRSAYIEIVHNDQSPIAIDPVRLIDIDEHIDDGDPSTGRLRLSGENLRYYIKF